MKVKTRLSILGITFGILAIPLLAIQFTAEVNWSYFDFLVMGILIFTIGNLIVLGLRIFPKHKLLVWMTLALVFFLIWAELAVGIFGTPFAGS